MSTLGIQGAAELMRVHRHTVEALIKDGALPAAKIGKQVVMLERDVIAYIERKIMEQTAERQGIPQGRSRSPKLRRKVASAQL